MPKLPILLTDEIVLPPALIRLGSGTADDYPRPGEASNPTANPSLAAMRQLFNISPQSAFWLSTQLHVSDKQA